MIYRLWKRSGIFPLEKRLSILLHTVVLITINWSAQLNLQLLKSKTS